MEPTWFEHPLCALNAIKLAKPVVEAARWSVFPAKLNKKEFLKETPVFVDPITKNLNLEKSVLLSIQKHVKLAIAMFKPRSHVYQSVEMEKW